MLMEKTEDLLSDVEPLPASLPPSPPPVSWPVPSVAHSWPSSPSAALASSRKVTARLYASLQRSREQEVRGYSAAQTLPDVSGKARQVSFKLSSPDLSQNSLSAGTSQILHQLDESEQAESSMCACPSPEEGRTGPDELLLEAEQQDCGLRSSFNNTAANVLSGRRHIEDMENVRSHLQTMIRTTQRPVERPETLCALPQLTDDDSFESDATTHLLCTSPPLSLGGLEELFPRYSRLRPDSIPFSSSETQVLQDNLERERVRRKQCEKQLLSLQNKALQLQQQLALAVSADRKKDIMIEQLDKTLAKVVEGWRRHEQEKSEGVRRLQEEKETAEAAQAKQEEVLAHCERSLSQAAETLHREQQRTEELQNTNKQLELEVVELRASMEELQGEGDRLRAEAKESRAQAGRLQMQAQAAQAQVEQHQDEWSSREAALQQELTLRCEQLERERVCSGQEVQLREEAQARLQEVQTELEDTRRDRDTARVDRALEQAQFEAQRTQWEVELRLSVEQQVTERLAGMQEENAKSSAKLREQHRKQLFDSSARHEKELSVQLDQFRAQLQERDERYHQLTQDYDKKLSVLQETLISMETSKRRLETQHAELVSRLQGMMRSHWTETLTLLTHQGQPEGHPLHVQHHSGLHSPPTDACETPATHTHSSVPQAVVLHLSREKERGRGDSDFSLLNHSQTFRPLEPLLDDTNLTSFAGNLSELWERPCGGGEEHRGKWEGERNPESRGIEQVCSTKIEERKREDMLKRGIIEEGIISERHVEVKSGPVARREQTTLNQGMGQFERQTQTFQSQNQSLNQIGSDGFNGNLNLDYNLSQNQSQALHETHRRGLNETSCQSRIGTQNLIGICLSPERQTCQSSLSLEKGLGRESASTASHSRDPPGGERLTPVRDRPHSRVSTSSEERQSELQYYISKLLDRSPGVPLESSAQEEHSMVQSKGESSHMECLSSRRQTEAGLEGPCVSPQRELSLQQLAALMAHTLPPAQLNQLYSLLRPEIAEADGLMRPALDQKLNQPQKKEGSLPVAQRQSIALPRPVQGPPSRGRRAGAQGQRAGPAKPSAWR